LFRIIKDQIFDQLKTTTKRICSGILLLSLCLASCTERKSEVRRDTKKTIREDKKVGRIGAVCKDGSKSKATGRGACSHHGGVDYWLYD
jgi:hypothetical protein